MTNSILLGILLGAAVCILNIRWLRFFVDYILINVKSVRNAKALTYITFFFRYIVIIGILYFTLKSHTINLIAFMAGFTIVLFSAVAVWLIHSKKETDLNGRTTSLY
ncbi:MAG: ATP synthase subunit I [Nitrospinae bacterium]|nr:ATP synthase subunit I [Nitrospinota bacterium]